MKGLFIPGITAEMFRNGCLESIEALMTEGEIYDIECDPSAQHWIPCSERYPDMDERVLVYTDTHDYYVWDCMSNRGDNYFWEDEDGFYHDKHEVEMWMSIPEPWRGEQDG